MIIITLIAYIIAIAVPAFAIYLIFALDLFGTGKSRIVIACTAWGASGAIVLAYLLNSQALPMFGYMAVVTFFAPIIEEILKALVLVYFIQRPSFRYIVDGAVYGFAAGIGFAMSENIFIYLRGEDLTVLSSAISRVLSTSLMHASASAMVGISMGSLRRTRGKKRYILPFVGILGAIAIHIFYNNLVFRLQIPNTLLLLIAIGIGISSSLLIAFIINWGLKDEKKHFEETLSLKVGVSEGERQAVQRLGESGIIQVVEELTQFFGEDKIDIIERQLVLQGNIGILQNNLSHPVSDRLREAWEQEIAEMRAEVNELRKQLGSYVMSFLQNVFPTEDTALWDTINEEFAEHDPTLVHTFDMFMRVSELAESFSPAELEKRAQQLSKIDIFENVTLANLENLSRAIKVEEFPAEHILFREGDQGDSMYMIEEGSLHIFVSENGRGENILRTFQKGQVVGEFSLLDGQPRSASARAYEHVRALVLSRQMFMMFIQSRPQVILAMLEYLSQKVRYTTQAVQAATEMAQKIADGDYESIRQSVMEMTGGKDADDSASVVRKAFASLIKALEDRESSFVSVPPQKQPPRKTMHSTLTQKITERSENKERASGPGLHSRIGDRLDERRIDLRAFSLPTSGSVAEWLRSYEDSIFSNVELSDLESLISMMENRHYEEGSVLFKEGDPGDSMYIILSGGIRVYIKDERGRERDVRQFQKGEFFGEFAFLDQQPRSASAAAIEPLDVLILDRERFTRFIEENPSVIFAMMRSLAYRIIGSDGPGQTLESIFEGAAPAEIAPLHAQMETISLERGDIVFEQDAKADTFYLIERGTVSTYIAYPGTKPIEDSTFVAGQIFGEIATFAESSYSMTAIAADHVELRVLRRDDFCDFLKAKPKMGMVIMKNLVARVRSTYKHLESISNVFRGMAWNDLKLLDEVMVSRTYIKGELLFEEGDPGDSMYIIKSGRIRIFLPDGKGGPLTLRYYGPNEVFGELALIDSRPRSASADVADALEVRVLYREDFHMLIHKRPSVGLAMIRNLTDRVRYTTNFLEKVLDWTEKASQGNFEDIKLSMREIDQQGQIGGLLQAFSDMIDSLQAGGSKQSHQN